MQCTGNVEVIGWPASSSRAPKTINSAVGRRYGALVAVATLISGSYRGERIPWKVRLTCAPDEEMKERTKRCHGKERLSNCPVVFCTDLTDLTLSTIVLLQIT